MKKQELLELIDKLERLEDNSVLYAESILATVEFGEWTPENLETMNASLKIVIADSESHSKLLGVLRDHILTKGKDVY